MKKIKGKINIDVMCDAISRLNQLLIKETEYIRNRKISEIIPILPVKNDLIQFLQNQQRVISQDTNILNDFNIVQKKALQTLLIELQHLSEENFQESAKAKYANEKVIEMLVNTVKHQDIKYSHYDKRGKSQTVKSKLSNYIQINEST